MSTPTTVPDLDFRPDPRGGYAVLFCHGVIGYVVKCERNPAVWEAYTDAERCYLRGQRSTRAKAAASLLARPTREVEIPDEAIEAVARALRGALVVADTAEYARAREVLVMPGRILVAHAYRTAALDLDDSEPEVAEWLEQRADEIDGGEIR